MKKCFRLIVILSLALCCQKVAAQSKVDEVESKQIVPRRALELTSALGLDRVLGANMSVGIRGGAMTSQVSFGYSWFEHEYVLGYILGILPGLMQPQSRSFVSPLLSVGIAQSFGTSGGKQVFSGSILVGSMSQSESGLLFSFAMGFGMRTEASSVAAGEESKPMLASLFPSVRADFGYAFDIFQFSQTEK